jgi:hypothetical protein
MTVSRSGRLSRKEDPVPDGIEHRSCSPDAPNRGCICDVSHRFYDLSRDHGLAKWEGRPGTPAPWSFENKI